MSNLIWDGKRPQCAWCGKRCMWRYRTLMENGVMVEVCRACAKEPKEPFFGTDSAGPQPNPVFRPHVDGKIQRGKLKG